MCVCVPVCISQYAFIPCGCCYILSVFVFYVLLACCCASFLFWFTFFRNADNEILLEIVFQRGILYQPTWTSTRSAQCCCYLHVSTFVNNSVHCTPYIRSISLVVLVVGCINKCVYLILIGICYKLIICSERAFDGLQKNRQSVLLSWGDDLTIVWWSKRKPTVLSVRPRPK